MYERKTNPEGKSLSENPSWIVLMIGIIDEEDTFEWVRTGPIKDLYRIPESLVGKEERTSFSFEVGKGLKSTGVRSQVVVN